jgi:hypothetical protein
VFAPHFGCPGPRQISNCSRITITTPTRTAVSPMTPVASARQRKDDEGMNAYHYVPGAVREQPSSIHSAGHTFNAVRQPPPPLRRKLKGFGTLLGT